MRLGCLSLPLLWRAALTATPRVSTAVVATGDPVADASVSWTISCDDGSSLNGGAGFAGTMESPAATRCTLVMTGTGSVTWRGFEQTFTKSGISEVRESFDICSSLCCTTRQAIVVCECRPADGVHRATPGTNVRVENHCLVLHRFCMPRTIGE